MATSWKISAKFSLCRQSAITVWVGSKGGHAQREGTNLGAFVPIWPVSSHTHSMTGQRAHKQTQICTFSLGMTAVWPYSNGAVQIRVGLELADHCPQKDYRINSGLVIPTLGCTQRGSYSAKGRFCLLSAFYDAPTSKNLSKNLCPYWNHYKAPSQNPSKKHFMSSTF